MSRIAVLGAGAWGTAMAIALARRGGHELTLWAHSPALADDLAETGENLPYLPGFTLPMGIQVTSDLPAAIFEADVLLSVTPSQYLRETIAHIAPLLTKDQIVISASKGIEEKSFLRMSQVIGSVTSCPCGVLSGPSFAQEVAAGMPTAIVGRIQQYQGGADGAERVYFACAAALYERRCGRGGTGWGVEECDCAGFGGDRGAGDGLEYECGSHYARDRGDHAAGGGVRWPAADTRGAFGHWRPGDDEHRDAEPESVCGSGAGQGTEAAGDSGGDERQGGRGREEHGGGAGAGGSLRSGDADCRADGCDPAPGKSPREAIKDLMARPGKDE